MIRNRQKELIKHISDQELLLNFYLSQLLILILALILGYIFLIRLLIHFIYSISKTFIQSSQLVVVQD